MSQNSRDRETIKGPERLAQIENNEFASTGTNNGAVVGNTVSGTIARDESIKEKTLEADNLTEREGKKAGLGVILVTGALMGSIASFGAHLNYLGAGALVLTLLFVAYTVNQGLKVRELNRMTSQQKVALNEQLAENIELRQNTVEAEATEKNNMSKRNAQTMRELNSMRNDALRMSGEIAGNRMAEELVQSAASVSKTISSSNIDSSGYGRAKEAMTSLSSLKNAVGNPIGTF